LPSSPHQYYYSPVQFQFESIKHSHYIQKTNKTIGLIGITNFQKNTGNPKESKAIRVNCQPEIVDKKKIITLDLRKVAKTKNLLQGISGGIL
jgi:hypothetical protein